MTQTSNRFFDEIARLMNDAAGAASGVKREVETAIYNTLPDNLDRLIRRHPLKCPVAFIGGIQSLEMQQVGMGLTEKLVKGRVMMLDGSHLFPMERPEDTAAAVLALLG